MGNASDYLQICIRDPLTHGDMVSKVPYSKFHLMLLGFFSVCLLPKAEGRIVADSVTVPIQPVF